MAIPKNYEKYSVIQDRAEKALKRELPANALGFECVHPLELMDNIHRAAAFDMHNSQDGRSRHAPDMPFKGYDEREDLKPRPRMKPGI